MDDFLQMLAAVDWAIAAPAWLGLIGGTIGFLVSTKVRRDVRRTSASWALTSPERGVFLLRSLNAAPVRDVTVETTGLWLKRNGTEWDRTVDAGSVTPRGTVEIWVKRPHMSFDTTLTVRWKTRLGWRAHEETVEIPPQPSA